MSKKPQKSTVQQGVYILELDRPLGNENHQARYYTGYTEHLEGRIWYHESGLGAAFTRAAVERGIGFKVVAWFPHCGRDTERAIKRLHNTAAFVKRYQEGRLSLRWQARLGIGAAKGWE